MKPFYLRCEYLVNPLGIDTPQPRFSWLLEDEGYNVSQSAYRILAASSPALLEEGTADFWDSGWVQSPDICQIPYAGKKLAFGDKIYWTCLCAGQDGRVDAADEAAFFTVGFRAAADRKGRFIYYDQGIGEQELAAPVCFARNVKIVKPVRSAYAYASALGVFTLDIGGKRASENILAPEWTSYFKRVQYQTYDVTGLLRQGDNTVTALLSNGWYCGLWQMWPPRPHIYGGRYPEFFLQLEITYADGSRETVVTDQSWRATTRLPIQFAGIYEGEAFDARIPFPDLKEKEIWMPASIGGRGDALILSAQMSEPIQVTQRLEPVRITQPKPGVWVVDFGQNFAGRVRARFHEKAGTMITIKHNEMLRPDGTVYMDNLITCEFLKGADRQIIRYICRGEGDEYAPRYTYMGFRYIELTGLQNPPDPADFVGEVFHTAFRPAGAFACSHEEINRLQQNIQWSHRANTMGVPTDCPQRDERCGYTGDMQFFMPTALYNGDMAAFMNKWLTDLCADSQLPDGRFKDHAPDFGMNGGVVGWGEAGIICPYLCYKTYGDIRNIRRHLTAMKRFGDYLISTANPDHTRGPDCVGLGDWLSMGGGASLEVIGTAYYAYTLRLLSEMADAVEDGTAAEYYGAEAHRARIAFLQRFILSDGRIKDSSLTGYALAITMGLVDNEWIPRVAEAFAKEVARQDYRLTTGFLGTPRLLIALGRIGRNDLAERLLMQRECPSWLYPVTVGATTIWERWNGWTPKEGFENPGMNSFNHFAFGSVGDYFFQFILGITQAEDSLGFRSLVIQPTILNGLTEAGGYYQGIHGKISVHWCKQDGRIRLDVELPPGTRAEVRLPWDAAARPAPFLAVEDREAGRVYICGAGRYQFQYGQKEMGSWVKE